MIDFTCEGCGAYVTDFGRDKPPVSGLCASCEWMCEFIPDPEQMMTLRWSMIGSGGVWNAGVEYVPRSRRKSV